LSDKMTRNLIIVITYAVRCMEVYCFIQTVFYGNCRCFCPKQAIKSVKSTCQRNSNYCYIFSGTFVDYADNKFYNTGTYKKYTSVFKQYGSIYR